MPPEGSRATREEDRSHQLKDSRSRLGGHHREDASTRNTRHPSPCCPRSQRKVSPPLQHCPPPSQTRSLSIRGRRPGIHAPRSHDSHQNNPRMRQIQARPAQIRPGRAEKSERAGSPAPAPPKTAASTPLDPCRHGPAWPAAGPDRALPGAPPSRRASPTRCRRTAAAPPGRPSPPPGAVVVPPGRTTVAMAAPPPATTAPRGRASTREKEIPPPPAPHRLCPAARAGGGGGGRGGLGGGEGD